MAKRCELTEKQLESTDRFKTQLMREGIQGAQAKEYVRKVDIGRTKASLYVDRDMPNNLVSFSMAAFVTYAMNYLEDITSFHLYIE